MATVRELAIRVTGDSSSYVREMNRATNTGTQFYHAIEERARRFDTYIANNNRSIESINSKLTSLGKTAMSAFAVLGGSIAVSGLVKMADDYGQMAIRVKMALESVTGDTEQFKSVQDRLFEMSNRNSKAIEQAQTLYIQTAKGMSELGLSTSQTVDVIETLNNEFTINATNAQTTESAINAFSKALLKGKIGSDELMSIMKAMPSLMGDVASSMGISETALKQMILNNKLPLNEFLQKIGEIKDKTSEMADSMQNTVADGFVQVSNKMKKYIGDANETIGVTANLASGLRTIADNFDLVANTALALTGVGLARYFGNTTQSLYASIAASVKKTQAQRVEIIAEKEKITSQLALIAVEKSQLELKKQNILIAQAYSTSIRAQTSLNQQLVVVEAELTAAKNAETAATERLTVANKSLNLVSRAGSGLLGLMGGPVGLIATVGVLAASFIDFSSSTDEATKSLVAQGGTIDELIEKYSQLGKAQQTSERTLIESESESLVSNIKDQLNKLYDSAYAGSGRLVFDSYAGRDVNFKSSEDFKNLEKIKLISSEINQLALEKNLSYDELNNKVQSIYDIAKNDLGVGKESYLNITNIGNQLIENSKELNKNLEYQEKINGIQAEAEKQAAEITRREAERKKLSEQATTEYENQLDILNKMLEQYNKVDAITGAINFTNSAAASYLLDEQKETLRLKLAEVEAAKKADEELKESEKRRQDAIKANEALKRESERQRERAQTKYNEIVNSLRTTEQKQLDEYKEKYDLIQKIAASEAERVENARKLAAQTVSLAPESAMSNYTGIGSDMINIANQDKELDKWHEVQLGKQAEFLKQKLINEEDYAENVAKIQEQYNKTRELNESAMQMATLGVFSSLTGDIADMFKETAGESSAAYKAMFLASKAAAIAQAMISTEVAAAKALELGGTAGIFMSNVVRGLGYASVGMIAGQTIAGMAHDGIDNIPKEGTWLLDKGERVVDARTNADLKSFIKSEKAGGNLVINIPINISDGQISDDNSKQLGNSIEQVVKAQIQKEQRPGGLLNRR